MDNKNLNGASEADPEFEAKFGHLPESIKSTYRASWRTQKKDFQHESNSKQILEGDGIRAGYKIEVHFKNDRSGVKDHDVIVLLYESGKFLNGDADDLMYLCMDRRVLERAGPSPSALPFLRAMDKKDPHRIAGCGNPIPSAQMALGRAACMTCQRLIDSSLLVGQIPVYGSTGEIAETLERLFRKLKYNSDIYVKYHPKDIRYEACVRDRIAKVGAIKGMEEARHLRGLMIYPLSRILKDVGSGSSLVDRFRALLVA